MDTARIVEVFQAHRGSILSTLGIAIILPLAINDYRVYMSMGPGGLPYNWRGWAIANVLRLFSREMHSSKPYDDPRLPFADSPGFLPPNFPPKRSSGKPWIGPHPAPQRQLDQLPDDAVRQKLIARFAKLSEKAQQMGLVEIKRSFYELQHSALFVSPQRDWHEVAQTSSGEIAHVHGGHDGTLHCVLHPKDCVKVFEAGFAQRHAFSGSKVLRRIPRARVPLNYVLIYAPRDDAEIEIALKIIEASIQFMTGTTEAIL